MSGELGDNQISALLESVPGIAMVLRNPVADALVGMIRAGARQGPFYAEDAEELVQYAVRRKIIGASEGEKLLADVTKAAKGKKRPPKIIKRPVPTEKRRAFGSARKKVVVVTPPEPAEPVAKKATKTVAKNASKKTVKKAAKKVTKKVKKTAVKKATKRRR